MVESIVVFTNFFSLNQSYVLAALTRPP
jgi:hypothetical protein